MIFAPLAAGIIGFLFTALLLLIPVGTYIWLRSKGILGDAPGRGMQ